jgi:hypothetical protein
MPRKLPRRTQMRRDGRKGWVLGGTVVELARQRESA